MTVTSGPGLSLMVETIGLAVAAEHSAVVVDVMRGGPSTGIPSKTEQSDVNAAIYGMHGDAPHVVLAPLSVAHCLLTTEWAVYVAELLQVPVIVLSDQSLGQAQAVIDPASAAAAAVAGAFPQWRHPGRQELQALRHWTLIRSRPCRCPGPAGRQWVGEGLDLQRSRNSRERGAAHVAQYSTSEHEQLELFDSGDLWGETFGDGDTAIVTFGSSVGPAREASRRLAPATGEISGSWRCVSCLHCRCNRPCECAPRAPRRHDRVLEQNHGAQLYRHLRGYGAVGTRLREASRAQARCHFGRPKSSLT